MKREFNYKEVAKEIGWKFQNMKYEKEDLTDFNFWKEIKNVITPKTKLLDLGCGSGEKTINNCSEQAQEICLTDIEEEMLKKAKENVKNLPKNLQKKFNFAKIDMHSSLPYENESFDLVIARHSGEATAEVFRILKKGGIFISEDIAKDDCQELKDLFGRGQNYFDIDKRPDIFKSYFELGFSEIKYYKLEIDEYYKTKEDLVYLLTHVPIFDYYDDEKDDEILEKYISKFQTQKGILLKRRLYGFYLKK